MIKQGNVILCKDGTRFLVTTLANTEEVTLVNLDANVVRFVDMPTMYVNEYHGGIAIILENIYKL